MVRSTIVCKDVCFFYDICTVCVIRLGRWVPVLCCMGAAEMAFCAACIWPGSACPVLYGSSRDGFLYCLHMAWERPQHG